MMKNGKVVLAKEYVKIFVKRKKYTDEEIGTEKRKALRSRKITEGEKRGEIFP